MNPKEPKDYSEKFNLDVFSERFNELLRESGLTQAEFAKKAGVNTNTIYRWRAGLTQVPYKRLYEIAHLFHVDPEYLYIKSAPKNYSEKYKESRISVMNEYYKPYADCLPSIIKVIASLGYTVSADLDNAVYAIIDNKNRSVAYLDRLLIEKILTGIKYTVVSDMEVYLGNS